MLYMFFFFGLRWPSLKVKHTEWPKGLPVFDPYGHEPVYYKIRLDPFVLLAVIFERLPVLFLFRFPLWWPCSCWPRSAMTTSSMPQNTNVLFPWTSSSPSPGVWNKLILDPLPDFPLMIFLVFQDSEFWHYQVLVWLSVRGWGRRDVAVTVRWTDICGKFSFL